MVTKKKCLFCGFVYNEEDAKPIILNAAPHSSLRTKPGYELEQVAALECPWCHSINLKDDKRNREDLEKERERTTHSPRLNIWEGIFGEHR
jgi:hypothetical protein